MADYVQKLFGLGAKNNMLRVLRKIEGFMMKILYPNITGIAYGTRVMNDKANPQPTGVFEMSSDTSRVVGGSVYSLPHLKFSAQKDNQLFSKSSTIQPLSFRMAVICRI